VSSPPTNPCCTTEPHWQSEKQLTNFSLPPALRYWLLDDGSLSNRLAIAGRGNFKVRRISQRWQTPLPSERVALGMPPRQLALIREVSLLVLDKPVVFARSIFPVSSLQGKLTHLRKLQNKPLGAILFKHPGMHRSPFELALLAGNSDYLPSSVRQSSAAWGRRSRFVIEGKPLMVSEVFLDGFTPWPRSLPIHRTQRGRVSAVHATPN
jgi:chorismate--pyruvate lyase